MASEDTLTQLYNQSDAGPTMPPSQASTNAVTADRDAALQRLYGAPPPADAPKSFLDRSWDTILGVGQNIASNYRTAGQPAIQDASGAAAPVHAPFMAGVARGVQDVTDTAHRGVTYATGGDMDALRQQQKQANASFDQEYGDSWAASGGRVVGQTLATAPIGGAAGNVASKALPWLARPAASVLGRVGQLGTEGAIQGGVTAGATGQDPLQGAVAGAVLGPAVTGATAALSYPWKAVTGQLPNMVDSDLAGWADKAQQYGIDIDPTKLFTNPTYKIAMDQAGKLPLSGAGASEAAQRLQWQGAVANQFGENAPNGITYDVMNRARQRIGQTFDDVLGRTTVDRPNATQMLGDLGVIATDIPRYGLTKDQTGKVAAQFNNIRELLQNNNGTITGQQYQNFTQSGGPLDSLINSADPEVAGFGMRIRKAMDDAFTRGATPADAAAYSDAAKQYRNMMTVKPLVDQRGAMGDLNPTALQQRVIAQSQKFDSTGNQKAFTGGGPMGELADIGSIFFPRQPESGTAARSAILGAIGGGGLVHALANPASSIPTAAAVGGGLLANRVAQSYLRNPAIGARMVANTLNPPTLPWTQMPRYGVSGATNLLNIGNQ